MQQITLTQPDDWHLHFRDNDMLLETVPATARTFKRAIVIIWCRLLLMQSWLAPIASGY